MTRKRTPIHQEAAIGGKKWLWMLTSLGVSLAFLHVMASPLRAQLANAPWPMFQHDLRHTGRSAFAGPNTANVRWTYKSKAWIKTSPTVGPNGTIYIGMGFAPLCAIDPTDGSELWCTTGGGDALCSSPAVAIDGTIYIGARDNKLWAVNPNGTVKWQYKVPFDGDVFSSPALSTDGNTVYTACNCLGAGIVHALNTADGSVQWTFAVRKGIRNSSPAIAANGTIYISDVASILHAFSPNGQQLWELPVGKKSRDSSSPVIGDDGTIYIGVRDRFAAVNPNGTFKWQFNTKGTFDTTAALAADGTIYVSAYLKKERTLYALNHQTGALLWSHSNKSGKPKSRSQSPSPVVDVNGIIYAGLGKGAYAFHPNGAVQWSYQIDGDIISLSLGDGVLYASSKDKHLYAFGAP